MIRNSRYSQFADGQIWTKTVKRTQCYKLLCRATSFRLTPPKSFIGSSISLCQNSEVVHSAHFPTHYDVILIRLDALHQSNLY